MKLQEFKKLIREEVRNVIKEASVDSLNFTKFKSLYTKMKRDVEDEDAQEAFLAELDNLAKQAGATNFESIPDAEGLLGDILDGLSVNDAISDFKDLLSQPASPAKKKSATKFTSIQILNPGARPVTVTVFGKREIYIQTGIVDSHTILSKTPTTETEVVNQLMAKGVVKGSNNKYTLNSKYKNYNAKQIAAMLK